MNKQFTYQTGDQQKTVTIEPMGDRFRVQVGQAVYEVAVHQPEPGRLDLEIDGQIWQAIVACTPTHCHVALAGETWALEKSRPRQKKGHAHGPAADTGSLTAAMPGLVREVLVTEGAEVGRGDTLVVLEAMKMELRLTAPYAGRVRRLHCAAGQVVERGQVLAEIEE